MTSYGRYFPGIGLFGRSLPQDMVTTHHRVPLREERRIVEALGVRMTVRFDRRRQRCVFRAKWLPALAREWPCAMSCRQPAYRLSLPEPVHLANAFIVLRLRGYDSRA